MLRKTEVPGKPMCEAYIEIICQERMVRKKKLKKNKETDVKNKKKVTKNKVLGSVQNNTHYPV